MTFSRIGFQAGRVLSSNLQKSPIRSFSSDARISRAAAEIFSRISPYSENIYMGIGLVSVAVAGIYNKEA